MKKFFFNNGTSDNVASLGVLVLRISIGLMMILGHGWGKYQTFADAKDKFPVPNIWMLEWMNNTTSLIATIFAEVICCALIVMGLATRPAAAVLAFTMAIAAFVVLAEKPFAMKEMAILYLIPAVGILIMGAGKYSFDAVISVEKKRMFR